MSLITGKTLSYDNISYSVSTTERNGTDRSGSNYYIFGPYMYFYASIKDVFLADDRCTFYLYKSNADRSGWINLGSWNRDGGGTSTLTLKTNRTSGSTHNDPTIFSWAVAIRCPYGDNKITYNSCTKAAYNNVSDGIKLIGSPIYYFPENVQVVNQYANTTWYAPSYHVKNPLRGVKIEHKEKVSIGGYL